MRTPFMKYAVAGAAALSLVAGGAVVAQAALTKNPAEVTAGNYDLDSGHGKITWSVNHLGFSNYVGQFTRFDATLTIDPAALTRNFPPAKFLQIKQFDQTKIFRMI